MSMRAFPVLPPVRSTAGIASGGSSLPIPSGVEVWEAGVGMFQDSGMTNPVTSAGQTLAKWVGSQGTVLTGTNFTVASNSGSLCARGNASNSRLALPTDYAMNRRDITVSTHCKRPGIWRTAAYFGFSATARELDFLTFSRPQLQTYDGMTVAYSDVISKASWHTATIRSNASALKVGINGIEVTKTAMAVGAFNGGTFQDLGGATGAAVGFDFVYGISLSSYADDAKFAEINAYWNSKQAIPSETNPTENWLIFGDSNTEGTNTTSKTSWVDLIAVENPDIRIVPVIGAAQYFQVGGSPMNTAGVATMAANERRASAGRNLIILAVTNDFSSSTGTNYYNNAKAFLQARQALGWEVAIVEFPDREAPYTTTDTTYNPRVADFNALVVSDPYADYVIDLATPLNGVGGMINAADGVHWTDAAQAAVKTAVETALGL